jgi:hypothetical protein
VLQVSSPSVIWPRLAERKTFCEKFEKYGIAEEGRLRVLFSGVKSYTSENLRIVSPITLLARSILIIFLFTRYCQKNWRQRVFLNHFYLYGTQFCEKTPRAWWTSGIDRG